VNFDNYESLQYFQRAIRRKGIVDALESMGINEGDTVRCMTWNLNILDKIYSNICNCLP